MILSYSQIVKFYQVLKPLKGDAFSNVHPINFLVFLYIATWPTACVSQWLKAPAKILEL